MYVVKWRSLNGTRSDIPANLEEEPDLFSASGEVSAF